MATDKSKQPTEGAQKIFQRLATDRDNYTQRAQKNATYTIPQLFPKESDDGGTAYETPYNSVGARGLNNLASKLLLALLPPGQPFFRMGLDLESQQALNNSGDTQAKDAIEYGMSLIESIMVKHMESMSLRPTLFEALKQLVIAGNALLFLPPLQGGVKCYGLRDYVVQRDGVGNVIQLVARDVLTKGTVPQSVLSLLGDTGGGDIDLSEKVNIYTHVYLVRGDTLEASTWQSYQEVNGEIIAGSQQSYPYDKTPWIPIRFTKKDGQSYGRSFVEDYIGDLISLENLTKAIVDMSMISAKVLYLVSPASQTNIRALAKASNGAFVRGRQEDVVPMQLNKSLDMQTAMTTAQQLESRLSYCFLLNSAVQRNGERVTAEQIRYVAGQLQDTLGGVYSLLSQELQLPLVRCIYNQLQSTNALPQINDSIAQIEPTIITGVDALGRGHDLANLTQAISIMAQFPEFMQVLNVGNLATRIFTAAHIDITGLVKSPEEVAQEQQAMMQQYAQQQSVDAQAQMAIDNNKANLQQ